MHKLPFDYNYNDIDVLKALNSANNKIGELNGIINLLPNPNIILNAVILGEAKESSEIENIVTTFDEIFKEITLKVNNTASKEVVNYRQAILSGYKFIKDYGFISSRMLIDIHHIIEPDVGGIRKIPGTVVKNTKTGEILHTPPQNEEEIRDYLSNLEKYINFIGFTSTPEIYFKNSSLHLFPSISECFPMVLCETKIYGIPNILIGLDYVKMAKGGTVILYDDSPESISRESINILKNIDYRKKLGKEARKSMKQFKNDLLLKRWVKLILSIFKGDEYYKIFKNQDKNISENKSLNIIKNQIKLLKMRNKNFENITINKLENFTFLEKINILNLTNN